MALLFLSVDKLARIPNTNSPLARVLRRYNVSNIKSFCGVSIFELCPRNLVTSPSVAHARASVLEYLRTPSQELDNDETGFKEFDVTSNCSVGQDQGDDDFFFSRRRSSDSSSSPQPQKLLLFLSVGLSSCHLWMTCCKKQTSNSASQPTTISLWTCMAGSSILNTFKRFFSLTVILCLSSPDDFGPVPASSFWFCRSVFIFRCFTAVIIMQLIVQSELPSVIGETSSQAKSLLLSGILLCLHRQWYNLYKRFSILLEMTDLLDLVADTDFHNAAAPKKPFLHLKSVRA